MIDRWPRRSRGQLIAAAGFAALGLALFLFLRCAVDFFTWERIERDGPAWQWRRGAVTIIDANRDGRIDEEITERGPGGRPRVRKDTDYDGWFDLRYELGQFGIAMNVEKIRERAPRGKKR
ncbi:MAG: hypothetical protein AB1705_08770 [Verrucomicrobiota bacterium]